MHLRKKPKRVEAIQVQDILGGRPWPDWFQKALMAEKISLQKNSLTTHIGRQVKTAQALDWIAYDIAQEMVYVVTDRTLRADYEVIPDEYQELPHGYSRPPS